MSNTTTETPADGGMETKAFLDDPYNMAMYVVLPTMIVVYGGCCVIYCVAKLRRYCRRRARKKSHLQKKDNEDVLSKDAPKDTAVISVVDLTQPEAERKSKPIVSRMRTTGTRNPAAAPGTRRPADAGVSTRIPARVVRPGYQPTGNKVFQQQMQHLDNQLKAAFKLITDEPNKPKSRPDVCANSSENRKPVQKRSSRKLTVSDQ